MSLDVLFPEQISAIYMSPHSLLSAAQVNQHTQPDYPSSSQSKPHHQKHHAAVDRNLKPDCFQGQHCHFHCRGQFLPLVLLELRGCSERRAPHPVATGARKEVTELETT